MWPNTMQGLVTAREKPPAQEQEKTGKKQEKRTGEQEKSEVKIQP
jgi:hypothetical protein